MKCILSDYYSGDHRPYRNMLRDENDADLGQAPWDGPLAQAIRESGAVDGDEIEIVVRQTGRRPFGDRRIVLSEPHTYTREPV